MDKGREYAQCGGANPAMMFPLRLVIDLAARVGKQESFAKAFAR
jgi:hypothetical protein